MSPYPLATTLHTPMFIYGFVVKETV